MYPIFLDGNEWPTTEHYFQAQKFAGTPHEAEIRAAATPMEAAQMGRQRTRPRYAAWWESISPEARDEYRRYFPAPAEWQAIQD